MRYTFQCAKLYFFLSLNKYSGILSQKTSVLGDTDKGSTNIALLNECILHTSTKLYALSTLYNSLNSCHTHSIYFLVFILIFQRKSPKLFSERNAFALNPKNCRLLNKEDYSLTHLKRTSSLVVKDCHCSSPLIRILSKVTDKCKLFCIFVEWGSNSVYLIRCVQLKYNNLKCICLTLILVIQIERYIGISLCKIIVQLWWRKFETILYLRCKLRSIKNEIYWCRVVITRYSVALLLKWFKYKINIFILCNTLNMYPNPIDQMFSLENIILAYTISFKNVFSFTNNLQFSSFRHFTKRADLNEMYCITIVWWWVKMSVQ